MRMGPSTMRGLCGLGSLYDASKNLGPSLIQKNDYGLIVHVVVLEASDVMRLDQVFINNSQEDSFTCICSIATFLQ